MRGIREVAVKPILLHVDTVWVDHFTAGTGGVGKELRMRNHKSVSESGSELRRKHCLGLRLRYFIQPGPTLVNGVEHVIQTKKLLDRCCARCLPRKEKFPLQFA